MSEINDKFLEDVIIMLKELDNNETEENYDKVIIFLRGGALKSPRQSEKMGYLTAISVLETRKRILKMENNSKTSFDSLNVENNKILERLNKIENELDAIRKGK